MWLLKNIEESNTCPLQMIERQSMGGHLSADQHVKLKHINLNHWDLNSGIAGSQTNLCFG